MLCVFMCFDKPNSLELRKSLRPKHLEWMAGSGVKVVYGGPLLADDGETPQGSLIIAEFADLAAGKAFQKNDPYMVGGLFERVVVQPTRQVTP